MVEEEGIDLLTNKRTFLRLVPRKDHREEVLGSGLRIREERFSTGHAEQLCPVARELRVALGDALE